MESSKVQTNEVETGSLKSIENGLKSSSESLGKHSLSNGSLVLKDKENEIPGNDNQQNNATKNNSLSNNLDLANSNLNGLSSKNLEISNNDHGLRDKSDQGIAHSDDQSGIVDKIDTRSDSESSSTLSSSSDESEDKENNKEQESQIQVKESVSHADSENSTNVNGTVDKDNLAAVSSQELIQKLQNAWRKCEELKEETKAIQKQKDDLEEKFSAANEKNNDLEGEVKSLQIQKDDLEEKLSAANEKNKNLSDAAEHLKQSNQELQDDINDKNQQLQSKLSLFKERDSTIEKLRAEVADLKSSRDSVETDLQDSREECSKLLSVQEIKEKSTKQQMESFNNLKSKVEEQEQEIGTLKDQLEIAKKERENHGSDKIEADKKLREDLAAAKNTVRSVNQANSKLEAKLSNSQTLIDTTEVECQKLKEEVKSLKDKIKWLERKRASEKESSPKSSPRSETAFREEQLNRKLSQESQRRIQERVRELEQKVIQVNDDKQKLQHDYEEAVKALEAVDKVYSVRELALQQYKADLDDANELLKKQSSEIQNAKSEMDQMKVELKRAEENEEENRAEQEELKEKLSKSKETTRIYKEEIEDIRKDLSNQTHELQMAQAKGRERGKRNQILELELREIKETLLISKNVIEEKEKNMESLRENLRNEKKNCKTLQLELEELDFQKKKLNLIEEEKARIVEKLKRTETDLKETQDSLKKSCTMIKEMEKEKESQNKINQKLKNKCEDQDFQIQTLQEVLDNKESDIEEQLIELIHTREQVDHQTVQLQDMWASYSADKALWKNKAGRSICRRPKSAPFRRTHQVPVYQSLPETKTHSLSHRRLVNKLGLPAMNPEYINTNHKAIPPATAQNNENQEKTDRSSPANNLRTTEECSTELSPRPPANNAGKTKPQRPLSSYGVRTYPPMGGEYKSGKGNISDVKNEDVWLHMDGVSITSGDTDEQVVKYLVDKGDRVLIQSKVVGDEKLNVSGVVKFVGKAGKKTNGPVYVGLKLDQPFGDNSGIVDGKQLFKCEPRHGKLIKMSEVTAVMHPRTKNYSSIKAMTSSW